MRPGPGWERRVPVLSAPARTFGMPGTAGQEGGTLILLEDRLAFRDAGGGTRVEIPLDDVERIGLVPMTHGPSAGRTALRVTHHGNLLFAAVVDRPERWLNAVEALTRQGGRTLPVDRSGAPAFDPRRFRVVIALALLLVILLGVLLPLFLSWIQARVQHPPSAAVAPPAAPRAAAS